MHFIALVCLLAPLPGAATSGDGAILLRGVTLVDAAGAAPRPGQSVLVEAGRIAAIGPELAAPVGAHIVDEGGFLIPGLFDMHVHLDAGGEQALAMLVVHGVTSARDMGGDLALLDARLRRVRAGELVGPRVARAGYVIESKRWLDMLLSLDALEPEEVDAFRRTRIGIETADDALEAVARVWESGADLLKFRNTASLASFETLLREAHAAGLRVAGHEPGSVDLLHAVSLGIGSLEHLPIYALMAETTEERWEAIYAAMVEHDVHATPTLVAMVNRRMTADELEERLAAEERAPRWRYLAPTLADKWRRQVPERRAEDPPLDWDRLIAGGERVARGMHRAGVRFLAGTDLGVALSHPGFALHEELQVLVDVVGLTPREALAAATVNAAAWLGQADELGTIEPGKLADLVLLEADPLEDIANVARIRAVIARGVWYGPAELDALRALAAPEDATAGAQAR